MKDDTQESGRRGRYFRYAVFSLAALLVVSLGFVLIPRDPVAPAAPPFSEQARASAFSDALSLRTAGLALERAGGDTATDPPAHLLNGVVTLLTVQAQALMVPSDAAAGSRTPALPATAPPPTNPPPTAPGLSVAGFAKALQASAAQRLKDAETADGGMARLLAGAGTAQLLAAEEVAAAAGIPLASPPEAGLPSPGLPSPAVQESAGVPTASAALGCVPGPAGDGASPGPAWASAAAAELELVYAYQAALVRLDAGSVPPASDFLAQHRALGDDAESLGRAGCAALPVQPAGYSLSSEFLAAPAAALGTLEAGTLPVYGDLVALSEGSDRAWALSALESATRRALHWGATVGPVPGLVLTEPQLPQLPEAVISPDTSITAFR